LMLSGSRDKKTEVADAEFTVLVKLITLRRWILVLAKT